MNLEEELLGLVAAPSESGIGLERDPFLSRLRLNVNLASRDPIMMDNNLAKIAGNLDVRLVGDYYRPSLLGRLTLEEGGELYLRERTYYLERGLISFYNATQIEPSLDLAAKTQVDEYEITLRISGEPGNLETSLTSEDPLPEPDIIALLVTGRKLEEARGEASAVLREQTLSLLTGTVTGRLERSLEQATGLSKVRIQPNLIAAESDPTARLTIGQDLTRQLGLIYSMDLTNGSDQIYIIEYDVTRHFTARVIDETAPEGELDSGAKYRFEVRHDLRIGGTPSAGPTTAGNQEKRKVRAVKLEGGSPFSEAELRKQLGVDPGDRYDFFKVRRGYTHLNDFLQKQGYLEARVRLSREEPNPETVELSLQIEPGSKVEFAYEGVDPRDDVKSKVREAWVEGVFDAQRAAAAEEGIRNQLVQDGFLEPQIEHKVTVDTGVKRVIFTTQPGTRYTKIEVGFQGVEAVPEERLREELRSAGLLERVPTASGEVKDLLKRVYRQEGHLQAVIRDPVIELHPDAGEARIHIPVVEGPRAVIPQVEFTGNSILSDEELLSASGLAPGQVYQPSLRDDAVARIEELYSKAGYNDATVEASLDSTPETGQARLAFAVQENRRAVVREVRIEGNDKTSDGFVRNQLAFTPGDVLTPDRVARSRRSLYDTGAYAQVEIDPQEMEAAGALTADKSVRAVIRVQEVRPYRLQYGGFYDTERGPGLIADFTNRNTVGNAATLGIRGRYDNEFREIRAYYSQPQLAGLPFDTNIATFLSRDIRKGANFVVDRAGFSLQQQKEFRNKFVLSYGYRFERDHSYDIGPDPFFDLALKVGRLLTSAVRDVRDDVLDASRGSFISQSLEFAPKWVGSDLTFGRYFGQYFQYVPLSQPSEIPWSGGVRKSRLVYAGGVRIGLARAFGEQVVVPSERFFAGGGTSIRGFEQDTIGPRNVIGDPAGGEAVFILNNELRFPLYNIFDGVGFVDVGNVYRQISDFNPFDVRSSAGFGLRIRTPYFLLRADYGLKLDRKADESRGAFFFSIGQAF